MPTPTRKKTLIVGGSARRGSEPIPVREFEVGKLVQIVSVRAPDPTQRIMWRQRDRKVELREPYNGALHIEYHKLERVPAAAYYPLKATSEC